ncbi:MAG: hypothetical protein KAR42_02535 [candidate division Zixibacteria bacterium]|nr:hypothetical protein [candidate division Zixibacteria bacterium]
MRPRKTSTFIRAAIGLLFPFILISFIHSKCPSANSSGTIQAIARVKNPIGITSIAEENANTQKTCGLIPPTDSDSAKSGYLIRSSNSQSAVIKMTTSHGENCTQNIEFTLSDGPSEFTSVLKPADEAILSDSSHQEIVISVFQTDN